MASLHQHHTEVVDLCLESDVDVDEDERSLSSHPVVPPPAARATNPAVTASIDLCESSDEDGPADVTVATTIAPTTLATSTSTRSTSNLQQKPRRRRVSSSPAKKAAAAALRRATARESFLRVGNNDDSSDDDDILFYNPKITSAKKQSAATSANRVSLAPSPAAAKTMSAPSSTTKRMHDTNTADGDSDIEIMLVTQNSSQELSLIHI